MYKELPRSLEFAVIVSLSAVEFGRFNTIKFDGQIARGSNG